MPDPDLEHSSERMKDRLRGLLKAGARTLVVASTVVVTAPVAASTPPLASSVIERVEAVRAQRFIDRLLRGPGEENRQQLSWHAWHNWGDYQYQDQAWGNVPSWHNVGGYRDPQWKNWQNWHNWHDWNDWKNRT